MDRLSAGKGFVVVLIIFVPYGCWIFFPEVFSQQIAFWALEKFSFGHRIEVNDMPLPVKNEISFCDAVQHPLKLCIAFEQLFFGLYMPGDVASIQVNITLV